ncbi:MAG TPA: hypothetical protein VE863_01600, partial [Pyrinomonadaceae bacterium]|nr:hypothetical protein [Pyrinomonadaceae bacterium]
MNSFQNNSRQIRGVVLLPLIVLVVAFGAAGTIQQTSIDPLELKLKAQYANIEKTIYSPPSLMDFRLARLPGSAQPPYDVNAYKRRLREWQDDLAQAFAAAANTVKQILDLNPTNRDYWQDRLETLELYSQPISSPNERSVFGASEMEQSARIVESPAAAY